MATVGVKGLKCIGRQKVCIRDGVSARVWVAVDSPKITCSSVGAYVGDTDVTLECAVRAKPPPTTMFWLVDANSTIVSDREASSDRFVVNKVNYRLTFLISKEVRKEVRDLYSAKVSEENQGALQGLLGGKMG